MIIMKLNFSIFLGGQSWTSLCKSIFDIIDKQQNTWSHGFYFILFLTLRFHWFSLAVRGTTTGWRDLEEFHLKEIISVWGPQHRVHTLLVHIRFDCTNPIHDEISFPFSIVIFYIERANIPKLNYQNCTKRGYSWFSL